MLKLTYISHIIEALRPPLSTNTVDRYEADCEEHNDRHRQTDQQTQILLYNILSWKINQISKAC